MILGYERLDHLVAISATSKRSVRESILVPTCELTVRFTDYVKSQVHLNVSADLFNRPLSIYVDALRFITGVGGHEMAAVDVLRYFYSDMSQFLINNSENILFQPEVDCELGIGTKVYRVTEVKDSLIQMINAGSVEAIRGSEFSGIIDCVESVTETTENESDDSSGVKNEIKRKIDSYAVAIALKNEAARDDVRAIIFS